MAAPHESIAENVAVTEGIKLGDQGTAISAKGSHVELTCQNMHFAGMSQIDSITPSSAVDKWHAITPIETAMLGKVAELPENTRSGKRCNKAHASKQVNPSEYTNGTVANRGTDACTLCQRNGFGHVSSADEQNSQPEADVTTHASDDGSSGRSPSIAAEIASGHQTILDLQTLKRRNQLFSQLRDMIYQEFKHANSVHTADHSEHVQQANLEQFQHRENHAEDLKEVIASLSRPGQGTAPEVMMLKKEVEASTDTAINTIDGAKLDDSESKGGDAITEQDLDDSGNDSSVDGYDSPTKWDCIRRQLREPLAEFLGCIVLMVFGNGVECQVILSTLYDPSAPKGEYLSISFGWGVGVAMGVWVAGGISGGMINPAVTIALACFRKFPWKKVPAYIFAQVAGCFVGSLCIYGLYLQPIRLVDPDRTETTAALFATYPAEFLRGPSTRIITFYNEFFASAILLIVILAMGDPGNMPPPDGMAPLVLLWLIVGLGACLGWQTAYAVNPARDLGPRLMLYIVGYPPAMLWTFNTWYWLWTPIIATIAGALAGCLIYDVMCYTGGDSPVSRKIHKHARTSALGT